MHESASLRIRVSRWAVIFLVVKTSQKCRTNVGFQRRVQMLGFEFPDGTQTIYQGKEDCCRSCRHLSSSLLNHRDSSHRACSIHREYLCVLLASTCTYLTCVVSFAGCLVPSIAEFLWSIQLRLCAVFLPARDLVPGLYQNKDTKKLQSKP